MADKKNTEIWDRLGKTDPKHTSKFQRAGGFKGTAIRPIYSIHRMTEEFGACGVGWGVNEPTFQVVQATDETLVFCTVSIWHGNRENIVFGVGGDKAVVKFSSGIRADDEAFKKAFTDAMTNAMKLIGVGADVHMGLFDDSKYVASLTAEKRQNPHVNHATDFHEEFADESDIPTVDATKMKVKDARPAYEAMVKEMRRITSLVELGEWGKAKAVEINSMPGEWPLHFRAAYADHKKSLIGEDA